MVREAEVEGHEVGIYDEEIGEVFLDGAYDFVVVCFGEAFEGRFLDDVAEVCARSDSPRISSNLSITHICCIPRTWAHAAPRLSFVSIQATVARSISTEDVASSLAFDSIFDYDTVRHVRWCAQVGESTR